MNAMADLAAVVDGLCAVDPAVLGDGETIRALHRQLARLEAVTTRAVAVFDAGREWEAEGARSAAMCGGALPSPGGELPAPSPSGAGAAVGAGGGGGVAGR
jgi:hypothetical protein